MFYTGDKKRGDRKVVTTEDEVKDILRQYHCDGMGGHSGVNSTLGKISIRYWWFHMKEDIREYVRRNIYV